MPSADGDVRTRIDAWSHAISKDQVDRISALAPGAHSRLLGALSHVPALYDMDLRLKIMDRFGNYTQVLTPVPGLHLSLSTANPHLAVDFVRSCNDGLARLVAQYPDRFRGFAGLLPMHHPQEALSELERVMGLGALGVQIETNINGIPVDHPQFEPIFARMAEWNKPIWIHPFRSPSMADYATEAFSRYALSQALGWPYETGLCLSRLVFAGHLERFPGLCIIGHHGGGVIPQLSGRLGQYLEVWGPKLDQELGTALQALRKPLLDYFRMFYVDTALNGAKHAVACVVEFFGADHVLFGTDTPFDPHPGVFIRDTIEDVEALNIDDASRRKICSDNAIRVLRISGA